jgi:hypothetical protein
MFNLIMKAVVGNQEVGNKNNHSRHKTNVIKG